MAFTTLVLAQLFNCFNARSDRTSAFHDLFTNPLLWGAIALSLALQVAVVQLPFLNDAFDTTPLAIGDWLVCVGLASIVLWASEGKKLLERWIHRTGALTGGLFNRACRGVLGVRGRLGATHRRVSRLCR